MKILKVIDLSAPIEHDGVVWPGSPAPQIHKIYIGPPTGTVEMVTFHTHTGTHMDAPLHMLENGVPIDRIPVASFLGDGTVVNLSYKKPKELIEPEDLKRHGSKVKKGDIVFIYTGWGNKVGFTREYMYEFPGLTEGAAKWFVEKGVKGIGVDVLGIDPYMEPSTRSAHETLMKANIWNVETLVNLDALLNKDRWFFIVLPIKLAGCGGAEARAIAIDQVEQ
jgi:kynurenine formamidase